MPNIFVSRIHCATNIDDITDLDPNQTLKLIAYCESGYKFAYWIDDNGNIIKSNPFVFYVPNKDTVHLTAVCSRATGFLKVFAQNQNYGVFYITYTKNDIEISEEQLTNFYDIVDFGSKVTLIAEPKEGYKFVGWMSNGSLISTDLMFTFNMPEEYDVTIIPIFELEDVNIQITSDKTLGAISGDGTYKKGQEVTIEAVANPTAEFIGWKINGEMIFENPYTFIAEQDLIIEAVLQGKTSNLLLNGNFMDYNVAISTPKTINYGELITLTAPEKIGYKIRWTINGSKVIEGVSSIELLGKGEDYTVSLDYIAVEDAVIYQYIYPNGSAQITINGAKQTGNTVDVIITALNNSVIQSVIINETTYNVNNTEFNISITLLSENTIIVNCKENIQDENTDILIHTSDYITKTIELPIIDALELNAMPLSVFYEFYEESDLFTLSDGSISPFKQYIDIEKLGTSLMFKNCKFAVLETNEPILDVLAIENMTYGSDYILFTFEPQNSFSFQNKVIIVFNPDTIATSASVTYLTINNSQTIYDLLSKASPLGAKIIWKAPSIIWIKEHNITDEQKKKDLNKQLSQYTSELILPDELSNITQGTYVTPVYGHIDIAVYNGMNLNGKLIQLL